MSALLPTLAETAATDPAISGAWALKLVAGIFSGLGILFTAVWMAFKKGQGSTAVDATVKGPVPEVTVRQATQWATAEEVNALRGEIDDLKADVDRKLDRLIEGQVERGRVAREALNNVHRRLDTATEVTAELKGEVHQISKNVERLLTLATTTPAAAKPTR
jgi:hypothetical protein